jgi:hypothetical protein
MNSHYHHLAFLLSLGGVPLACAGDDAGGDGEPAATAGTLGTAAPDMSSGTGDEASLCEKWAEQSVECRPEDGAFEEVVTVCEATFSEGAAKPGCHAALAEYYTCYTAAICDPAWTDETCYDAYVGVLAGCYVTVGETCAAFAEWIASCYGEESLPMYAVDCQVELDDAAAISPDCGQSMEAWADCMVANDCADAIDDGACDDAQMTAMQTCYPPGATCTDFGAMRAGCAGEDPLAAAYSCQEKLVDAAASSPECGGATEEFYACLSALSCVEVEGGNGCMSEGEAMGEAC